MICRCFIIMAEELYKFYILIERHKIFDQHGYTGKDDIKEKEILVRKETALLFNEIINKGCTTLRRPNEDYGERDLYMF